ncbi:MAG: chorismate mutase [Clostridia bacterium]|nr:chorismate mutase [Clostridia bacterium]
MDLKKIRRQIDRVDSKIIKFFQKRMKIVDEVTKYKIEHKMEVLDVTREKNVIDNAAKKVDNPILKSYIPSLYSTIMGISRRYQTTLIKEHYDSQKVYSAELIKNPKTGYLGIEGSFSYQAASEYFEGAILTPFESFESMVDAVINEEIDYAVLPVENTSSGNVDASIDILAQKSVWIIDEYILKIRHNLLGIEGAKETDIKKVYSHYQAIKQCGEYLEKHKIFGHIVESTAHGAKMAVEEKNKETGAIASGTCAKLYGLNVIKEDIQTNKNNYTKFAIVAKDEYMLVGANKISIVATLNHRAGSLHELISIFADNSVNLLKIVSRPIANNPWEYNFHLDFSGNLADENVAKAIEEAKKTCLDIKVLGCYRAYERIE